MGKKNHGQHKTAGRQVSFEARGTDGGQVSKTQKKKQRLAQQAARKERGTTDEAAPSTAHKQGSTIEAIFAHKVHNSLSRTSSTTRAHLTSASFAALPLSQPSQRAISEVLGYEQMTLVQEQTLPVALEGKDIIAKAKTGTGKTIAFLLPTIEQLAAHVKAAPRQRGVLALAISPTRELASQIRDECEQLITFHKPALSSRVVFGGTNVHADVKGLTQATPSVLVATPGRLNDLLANHGLASLFDGLRALIFDEADQLLEMGFRPDVLKLLAALKPSAASRQTLLFSATLPKDVLSVAQFATRNAQLIDTVGESAEQTNVHVAQSVTLTSLDEQASELLARLVRLVSTPPYKVVVFFVTARLTQLYAEAFQGLGMRVLEMHSRKSQAVRTRVADEFRDGDNLIMFSSDVSARGMDYPDVTAVVQVACRRTSTLPSHLLTPSRIFAYLPTPSHTCSHLLTALAICGRWACPPRRPSTSTGSAAPAAQASRVKVCCCSHTRRSPS
jgi:superfamily II DNA/RNA helicase